VSSVFFQRYIEAEESYQKVLSLNSECEDARQQLLDVQAMQLCQHGYNKEQALKALRLTVDNITHTASIEVIDMCYLQTNWFIATSDMPFCLFIVLNEVK
jgi:hypothetical protein